MHRSVQDHHFDEFIFATTWSRDAKLQKVAAELTQQYEKPIVLWSWDDLQDKVNVHPHPQRLFADGSDATGVALIDQAFLNCVASIPANSLQFNCGLSHDDLQWERVARNHDAPRIVLPTIQTRVEELFALPLTEARVAAVVHGEGSSG